MLGRVLVLGGLALVSFMGCSSSDDAAAGGGAANGDAGSGDPDPAGGQDAGGACTPASLAPVTAVPKDARLVDLAVDAEGAWLLVRGQSERSLTVVRPSGESKVLEAANVTAAALSGRSDGKVCAAWGVSQPSAAVHYACGPDFARVDTGLALEIDADAPLALHDEPTAGAMLFQGKFASLDGVARAGSDFRDANIMESSISYPGGVHALTGAQEGAPYCFVASQGAGAAPIVVKSWMRSGSANSWGSVSLDGASATWCAAAFSGATLGVLATGGGEAKFATGVKQGDFAGQLAAERFGATEVRVADLAADAEEFAIVYGSDAGAFRASRGASAKTWVLSALPVPAGVTVTAASIAKDSAGEHIAVQAGGVTYYQRSCR